MSDPLPCPDASVPEHLRFAALVLDEIRLCDMCSPGEMRDLAEDVAAELRDIADEIDGENLLREQEKTIVTRATYFLADNGVANAKEVAQALYNADLLTNPIEDCND